MKKKNKIKVPAHMFGMFAQIGQAVEGVGDTLQENGNVELGSALSGAANPAKAGLQYLNNKDVSAGNKLLAFTGLGSIFAAKQAKRAQERRAANVRDVNAGLNNTAMMNQNYWGDNDLAYTYATGGVIPNDLAYLDNDEVVRDSFGNIDQVPNNGSGTDSHLVDSSNLESVLSDKLKRPGTNKTFAQEGEKLVKMSKSSKGKDRFAQASDRLNKLNANRKYNELLIEQEELKEQKGIKPKSKDIPAYADGKGPGYLERLYKENFKKYLMPNGGTYKAQKNAGYQRYAGTGAINRDYIVDPMLPKPPEIIDNQVIVGDTDPQLKPISYPTRTISKANGGINKAGSSASAKTRFQPDIYPDQYTGQLIKTPTAIVAPKQFSASEAKLRSNNEQTKTMTSTGSGSSSGFNFGNIASAISGIAPMISNLIGRDPESEEAVINPYLGSINRALARRKMNIEPAMQANARSRAIANYNAANANANTGSNLAFRTQAAVSEYAANADMYATKQNADNAYLGDYANTLNNLGQQYTQAQTLVNENNARNRAAARSYSAQGLSQLGQWGQLQQQMSNQQGRDDMLLPFLTDFLKQGYTQDMVNQATARTRNIRF